LHTHIQQTIYDGQSEYDFIYHIIFVAQEPTLIVTTSGKFMISDGNYALLFSCHLLNIAHESCGQWPEVQAITQFFNSTNAQYKKFITTWCEFTENMYSVSRGYQNDATTFEFKESLRSTVKASASILDTGHLRKTHTIVTGEIQHVNGNKLSICCMEQLSRFFRTWQSQIVCTLNALIKYMPRMW
jgi:hypothetical protein